MKTGTRSEKGTAAGRSPRSILVVDGPAGAKMLEAVWHQLRLSDHLRVVTDPETAISLLREAARGGDATVAAVVLDPETTGKDTGTFLRRARVASSGRPVPMVLWSHDGAKYAALKENAVASLVRKPMILRVIQVLDEACGLGHRPFAPFVSDTLARQQAGTTTESKHERYRGFESL